MNKKKVKWTEEQERLLINWAEKASGYAWLHNKSVTHYKYKNLYISGPACVCAYIAGATSLISTNESGDWESKFVGLFSILAGILTNLQEVFTFKELSEQHRISGLQFSSFFRDISVEMSLHPDHRKDPIEYITLKRMEFDKLLEQSPITPKVILNHFDKKFKFLNIHKPDIATNLQTIVPYRGTQYIINKKSYKKLALMEFYFKRWRGYAALKKANYIRERIRKSGCLIEVANSESNSSMDNILTNNYNINLNYDNSGENTTDSSQSIEGTNNVNRITSNPLKKFELQNIKISNSNPIHNDTEV
uniref:SMODS and SLOG-associating 2TM effector domain-containing protein n=1 Tax=viral metagenome TaxID=1070528 RepID=A0A6C0KDK5_9ZZZZ